VSHQILPAISIGRRTFETGRSYGRSSGARQPWSRHARQISPSLACSAAFVIGLEHVTHHTQRQA